MHNDHAVDTQTGTFDEIILPARQFFTVIGREVAEFHIRQQLVFRAFEFLDHRFELVDAARICAGLCGSR